ncbi:MAG TPA: hypothetical protein PKC92_12290 [Bacteroidia bacterium]|nr:hypothetical protein [Bacteroidia bacterium]
MKFIFKIVCPFTIVIILSSCNKKLPDVYYDLNFCDTCLSIGSAIEHEKQNNSLQLLSMSEEDIYLSAYHVIDTDYYIRRNKGSNKKHIYSFKCFLNIDTLFNLKILKVYKYLYYQNEDSLLHKLAIREVIVKVFHTDPVIDSL